ncbi:hypothetical protein [Spirosoma utsteinense]|uniref:RagB/SusD family nutrient uptake outer membrane protein n=1 Tax=Spirosoma utsteinense TaxID=2585773 RepID=A0ABR6WEB3_9BACT|nr:hypothetical protein [Spirosoma utsteinense]MBC3794828.1 hypothetical protein [Spirosoma utsteinense]
MPNRLSTIIRKLLFAISLMGLPFSLSTCVNEFDPKLSPNPFPAM